jgi:hypothetical protein
MRLRYDRAVLVGSGIALAFFVLTGLALYSIAPAEAMLRTRLIESLFDKLALGGVLSAFALIVGWYIEDAKARRTFVATAQLTAATDMLARASALAAAASDWLYYEAPETPAEQPYGRAFEGETIAFSRSWGSKSALLPTYFHAALKRFSDLLMEPYYLYRDRTPNPLGLLGTTNLDAAEFIGGLERSLYCEFLAGVGAPTEQPEIRLSAPQRSNKDFRDTLVQWEQVRSGSNG